MKKLLLGLLTFVLGSGIGAVSLYTIWSNFSPEAIIGSNVKTTESDLKIVANIWFNEFLEQYKGWSVPYEYRLKDMELEQAIILNQAQGDVQLDYCIKPASDNNKWIAYYSALESKTKKGWYDVQIVLSFKQNGNTYGVYQKMTPVQYQIKHDSSLRDPQTSHYAMQKKQETYVIENNTLYVTYDSGKNLKEVPVSYESFAGTNNSTYNELLPEHGYIVSKSFTAFVCYKEEGSYLIYSENAGNTWKTLDIINVRYRGDTLYLSKTNTGCYITIATDRLLGHEYYSTFKTNNFVKWEQLSGDAVKEAQHVVFLDNGIGYIPAGHDDQNNTLVNYTQDDGNTFQQLTIPAKSLKIIGKMYKPFIQMEYVYQEDDKTYMIIGQGPNGDYAKDNVLVKGVYVSDDGINFKFLKEITDAAILVG